MLFNPFQQIGNLLMTSIQGDNQLDRLLDTEKKATTQWKHIATRRNTGAKQLSAYGQPLGKDLEDVLGKTSQLLATWSDILGTFADQYEQYYETLKAIAERERLLAPARDRKRRMHDTIKRLEDLPGMTDKVQELKDELRDFERFTEADEIEIDNFKRVAAREALYLLLNAMHEMAGKTDIVASFGKYIVDELCVTPRRPGDSLRVYKATQQTERIVHDTQDALRHWRPDAAKIRRTLTTHHGRNPLIVDKPLPQSPTTTINEPTEVVLIPTQDSTHTPQKPNQIDNPLESESSSPTESMLFSPSGDSMSLETNSQEPVHPSAASIPSGPTSTLESPMTSAVGMIRGQSAEKTAVPDLGPPPPIPPRRSQVQSQAVYQFYQHYSPPRPYDDVAQFFLHPRPGMFLPSSRNGPHGSPDPAQRQSMNPSTSTTRADPGGFILPTYVTPSPLNLHPESSSSTPAFSKAGAYKSSRS